MAEDELRKYARLSTQIRGSFKAKADELKAEENKEKEESKEESKEQQPQLKRGYSRKSK